MKFQVMHRCPGRLRVRAVQGPMSLEQADLLEAYLSTVPGVEQAVVHERTGCAVIRCPGAETSVRAALARFSYDDPAVRALAPAAAH